MKHTPMIKIQISIWMIFDTQLINKKNMLDILHGQQDTVKVNENKKIL